MKLTPKKEKFSQKYVELGNASEAYRQSYNAKNMTTKTINEAASRLLNDSKVAARIKQLQERLQKRHEVTVDSITAELEQARILAMMEKQAASAVSASNSKAKLHGLLNDKVDVDGEIRLSIKKNIISARDRD